MQSNMLGGVTCKTRTNPEVVKAMRSNLQLGGGRVRVSTLASTAVTYKYLAQACKGLKTAISK
eukprot:6107066-Amphidinium_carterae.1